MKFRTLAVRLNGDGTLERVQLDSSGEAPKSRVQVCPHVWLSLLPFSLGWRTVAPGTGEAFRRSLLFNAPSRLAYIPRNDPRGRVPFTIAATAVLRPGVEYLPISHPGYDRFIAEGYTSVRTVTYEGRPREEVWDPDNEQWRPLETFFLHRG